MARSNRTRCVPGSTRAPAAASRSRASGRGSPCRSPRGPAARRRGSTRARRRTGPRSAVAQPRLGPRALLGEQAALGVSLGPAVPSMPSTRAGRTFDLGHEPSLPRSREVEPGRLQLGVAVERVEPLVAPEPRLLVAAERDGDVGGVERVDPDDPGPDRAGQPVRPVHVAGPQAGREAERRVVRDAERVGLVLELGDGQDRPEDLLARHAPPVVDAVEDRGLDVEPAGLLAHALATRHDPRALLASKRHVAEDLLELALVDDRAESRRRIEGFARRELRPERRDPLDELLPDRAVDDEPRPGVAGLPAVVEDPPADRRRRPPRDRRRRPGRPAGSCRRARARWP